MTAKQTRHSGMSAAQQSPWIVVASLDCKTETRVDRLDLPSRYEQPHIVCAAPSGVAVAHAAII